MTLAAWSLLAALIIAYLPRIGSIKGAVAMDGAYDNLDPRAQQARLKGSGARSQAAHQNALESLPGYVAGIWVAHTFGADPAIRDGLAIAYLVLRLVYWYAYVREWGAGRSLIWAASMICIIALFVFAAL